MGLDTPTFSERKHFTPKINITFYIINYVMNIFLRAIFFEKSSNFPENPEKLFFGSMTTLERNWASDDKNKYNIFKGK